MEKKKFYISSMTGESGLAKYSRDFYNLVLKDKGYRFIDSSEQSVEILSAVSSIDQVHIEIGIFQKKEIQILLLMLKAKYKNVSVTLHDAPLIKYPFIEFKNNFLNKVSKFSDIYTNISTTLTKYVRRIKSIYVLSFKGAEAVKRKYKVTNVYKIPHIVDVAEMENAGESNSNFIYFGFIGRNKGIEYSLRLHQELLASNINSHFFVVGKAMGAEKKFYEMLRGKYTRNVHYMGYIPETELAAVFSKATFALIPFNDYRFYSPTSGSILYSLKKGKIVITSKVNTIPEIIEHGRNGFFLTGNLKKDAEEINAILNNKVLLDNVKKETRSYIISRHSAANVKNTFKD